MYQLKAKVIANRVVASGVHRLTLFSPKIALQAKPGQFVHVACGFHHDYILRRPFSIHQSGEDSIDILFQIVGKGTAWLAKLKTNDSVDLLGPLGRGFQVSKSDSKVLMVAGGMGIAPMMFLASYLVSMKVRIYLLIGAANKELFFDYMDLKRLARHIVAVTEDGSFGEKGLVTDFFDQVVDQSGARLICACGPKGMLAKVAQLSFERKLRCQVALEELMACGVGACLSCVVKTKSGYKKLCTEGPVLDASEVDWQNLIGSSDN